jgi:hypothetical protein
MPRIYRKTPKGQAEIETRANRLVPRLRTALIMVDGKRDYAELRPLLMQAADETLASLLEQGFIEIVGGAVPAAPAAASPAAVLEPEPALAAAVSASPGSAAPASAAAPTMRPMPVPLSARQREAVRLLTDQIGPMAESLAIRIERVRSSDELRAAVALAAQVIANTRGRRAAETYSARFADL